MMFKKWNEVTMCVDLKENLTIQRFVDKYVKTKGIIHIDIDIDDVVYIRFRTKMKPYEITRTLNMALHELHPTTKIVGDLIIVRFYK